MEDSQKYNVERIVDYKEENGEQFLFIKWEDYADDQNTWEPLDSIFNDLQSMVEQFFFERDKKIIRSVDRKG